MCKPRVAIEVSKDSNELLHNKGIEHWNDIFNMTVEENTTCLDALEELYRSMEKEAILTKNLKNMLPRGWTSTLRFSEINDENNIYTLTTKVLWAIFKGKTECHLYNGSYCFNNNAYLGDMRTPAIDTYEFHPGVGFWEEVKDATNLPNPNMVVIFGGSDFKAVMIENLGNKKF